MDMDGHQRQSMIKIMCGQCVKLALFQKRLATWYKRFQTQGLNGQRRISEQ